MGNHLREIHQLTRARVVLFLREKEAIFWVFIFPLVLAAVLGFAFRNAEVAPSTVALVMGDGAAELRAILELDEQIKINEFDTYEEAFTKLRKASVDGLIEPGDPPQMKIDPARAEGATARLRFQRVLALAANPDADPPLKVQEITETGSRYVDFLFPGLLGMNLMGTGMWGVGFAIADMRRRKFLKRLLVTPMRRSSLLLSFILSRLVFLVLELAILVSFGYWVLGVPFNGNLLAFFFITLLSAISFSGLGILVASRVQTIEGVSGLMNFVMMPMWLLSGVFFGYDRFPEVTHFFIKLLPLTAANDALRGVMIDGESLFQLGPEVLVIGGWCVVCFVVALKIFRWE